MYESIKRKWVEALTSGEYAQSRYSLHRNNRFCCLGVLTDIYAKEKGLEWHRDRDGLNNILGECNILPCEVLEWSGLDTCDGTYIECDEKFSLAQDNDAGYSFARISDTIERHF